MFSHPNYSYLNKSEKEIGFYLDSILDRIDMIISPKSIVIDDIFILHSYLKYSIQDLLCFLSRIKSSLMPGDILIILYHADTTGKYENDLLTQLKNYCTTIINVMPLTTGNSPDITGDV